MLQIFALKSWKKIYLVKQTIFSKTRIDKKVWKTIALKLPMARYLKKKFLNFWTLNLSNL